MPARTEPVIDTICGISCATSARPVAALPHTTFRTPGGRNSAPISASSRVVTGVAAPAKNRSSPPRC
jgi:hypothetical protein